MGALGQGRQIVDDLVAAGVRAHIDAKAADTNRPCVLVLPPVVDYSAGATMAGPELRWRVACLSSHSAGTVEAWTQLDDLLDDLVDADVVTVEKAEPGSYQLSDTTTCPAYIATATT